MRTSSRPYNMQDKLMKQRKLVLLLQLLLHSQIIQTTLSVRTAKDRLTTQQQKDTYQDVSNWAPNHPIKERELNKWPKSIYTIVNTTYVSYFDFTLHMCQEVSTIRALYGSSWVEKICGPLCVD